ncbi:MFS transporter [Actinomadura atramentaria]|uniref:MFS transporter n=1 Tax=Actinomadura atramentaria TaxID=1990 RepID=UPI000368B773|nr:MFS transporter [Actinomadura atramentaria]
MTITKTYETRHRWVVLAIGVAAQASFAAMISGLPVTGVVMRDAYGLTTGQLGIVLGGLGLGIALSDIAWGLLTDRLGDRRVLLTGLLATGALTAAMACAAAPADGVRPAALAACLFAAGALGGSVNGASGRAVMTWFDDGRRGLAMSIRQTAIPAGGAVGVAALPPLAAAHGFRAVYLVLTAFFALSAAATWHWLREPGPARPARPPRPARPARSPHPTHPARPAHPAHPAGPPHPASPASPAHSASPAHPGHPAHPASPAHPSRPPDPARPPHPAHPAHPASPAHPERPPYPARPPGPVRPASPVRSVVRRGGRARVAVPVPAAVPRGRSPLLDADVWRVALASALLTVPQFAVLTFTGIFLHDARGAGGAVASAAVLVAQLGGGAARIWTGRRTDRGGDRRSVIRVIGVLAAVAMGGAAVLVHAPLPLTAGALALGGLLANAWHGVAYTEIAVLAGADRAGTALGLEGTAVFGAAFVTPVAVPPLLGATSWTAVWACAAAAALLAVPLTPPARRR